MGHTHTRAEKEREREREKKIEPENLFSNILIYYLKIHCLHVLVTFLKKQNNRLIWDLEISFISCREQERKF